MNFLKNNFRIFTLSARHRSKLARFSKKVSTHYHTQHNDIQYKDTQYSHIQHNNKLNVTLSIMVVL
jgi:hypothetical protein